MIVNIILWVVLYLIGAVLGYLLCKLLRGTDPDTNNEWNDVFLTIIYSLTSWVCVFVLSIVIVIALLCTLEIKKFNKKPPKWM